jgi:hypothetical protein
MISKRHYKNSKITTDHAYTFVKLRDGRIASFNFVCPSLKEAMPNPTKNPFVDTLNSFFVEKPTA